MIQATHRVTELRWCADSRPGEELPPFVLSCNIMWESPNTVWITMMVGEARRHHLRELETWMRNQGVTTVKAHRAHGHRLPGFKRVNAHFERNI